jgi:hypothetical protein
MLPGTR